MDTPSAVELSDRSNRGASLDSVVSAVADEHLRAILRILNRSGVEAMDLDALADAVTEQIDSAGPPDGDSRHQIRIELHHLHLPKLKSYGMVRYDTETKEARSSTGELNQELLTVVESYETNRANLD